MVQRDVIINVSVPGLDEARTGLVDINSVVETLTANARELQNTLMSIHAPNISAPRVQTYPQPSSQPTPQAYSKDNLPPGWKLDSAGRVRNEKGRPAKVENYGTMGSINVVFPKTLKQQYTPQQEAQIEKEFFLANPNYWKDNQHLIRFPSKPANPVSTLTNSVEPLIPWRELSNIDAYERMAIKKYTGHGDTHKQINQYHRGIMPTKYYRVTIQDFINNIDSLMDKSDMSPLGSGHVLYRGVPQRFGAFNPGEIIPDRAYKSFSTEPGEAYKFAGTDEMEEYNRLIQNIPTILKYLPHGKEKGTYEGGFEHEVILKHGQNMRVIEKSVETLMPFFSEATDWKERYAALDNVLLLTVEMTNKEAKEESYIKAGIKRYMGSITDRYGMLHTLAANTSMTGKEQGTILSGDFSDLKPNFSSTDKQITFNPSKEIYKEGAHIFHTHPNDILALSPTDFTQTALAGKAHTISSLTSGGDMMTAGIPAQGVPIKFVKEWNKKMLDTIHVMKVLGLNRAQGNELLTNELLQLAKTHGVSIQVFKDIWGQKGGMGAIPYNEEFSVSALGKRSGNDALINKLISGVNVREADVRDIEAEHAKNGGGFNEHIARALRGTQLTRDAISVRLPEVIVALDKYNQLVGALHPSYDTVRGIGTIHDLGSTKEIGGVGSSLVGKFEETCKKLNIRIARLIAEKDAIPWYLEHGWNLAEGESGEGDNTVMEKYLSPMAGAMGSIDIGDEKQTLKYTLPTVISSGKGKSPFANIWKKLTQQLGERAKVSFTQTDVDDKDAGIFTVTLNDTFSSIEENKKNIEKAFDKATKGLKAATVGAVTLTSGSTPTEKSRLALDKSEMAKQRKEEIEYQKNKEKESDQFFDAWQTLGDMIAGRPRRDEAIFSGYAEQEGLSKVEEKKSSKQAKQEALDYYSAWQKAADDIVNRPKRDQVIFSGYAQAEKEFGPYKEHALNIGSLMDSLTKKGGAMSSLSWQFASVAMSSMGVYFSIQGIVTMIERGLTMIFNPLMNLQDLIKNIAQSTAFTPNIKTSEATKGINDFLTAMLGKDYMTDIKNAWMFITGTMSTVQSMLGGFAAKVLIDPDVQHAINNIVGMLGDFLLDPKTFELVKDIILSLEKAMPNILGAIRMIGQLIKDWIIPHADMLAFAWAISVVIQPLVSIVSFFVNITKSVLFLTDCVKNLGVAMELLNAPRVPMMFSQGNIPFLGGAGATTAAGGILSKGAMGAIDLEAAGITGGVEAFIASGGVEASTPVALGGAGAAGTGLATLIPVIGTIIGLVVILTAAWSTNWGGFRDGCDKATVAMGKFGKAVEISVNQAIDNNMGKMSQFFKALYDVGEDRHIKSGIETAGDNVALAWLGATKALYLAKDTYAMLFGSIEDKANVMSKTEKMKIIDSKEYESSLDYLNAWVDARNQIEGGAEKPTSAKITSKTKTSAYEEGLSAGRDNADYQRGYYEGAGIQKYGSSAFSAQTMYPATASQSYIGTGSAGIRYATSSGVTGGVADIGLTSSNVHRATINGQAAATSVSYSSKIGTQTAKFGAEDVLPSLTGQAVATENLIKGYERGSTPFVDKLDRNGKEGNSLLAAIKGGVWSVESAIRSSGKIVQNYGASSVGGMHYMGGGSSGSSGSGGTGTTGVMWTPPSIHPGSGYSPSDVYLQNPLLDAGNQIYGRNPDGSLINYTGADLNNTVHSPINTQPGYTPGVNGNPSVEYPSGVTNNNGYGNVPTFWSGNSGNNVHLNNAITWAREQQSSKGTIRLFNEATTANEGLNRTWNQSTISPEQKAHDDAIKAQSGQYSWNSDSKVFNPLTQFVNSFGEVMNKAAKDIVGTPEYLAEQVRIAAEKPLVDFMKANPQLGEYAAREEFERQQGLAKITAAMDKEAADRVAVTTKIIASQTTAVNGTGSSGSSSTSSGSSGYTATLGDKPDRSYMPISETNAGNMNQQATKFGMTAVSAAVLKVMSGTDLETLYDASYRTIQRKNLQGDGDVGAAMMAKYKDAAAKQSSIQAANSMGYALNLKNLVAQGLLTKEQYNKDAIIQELGLQSLATGGSIKKGGLFNLHAGEAVVPATQNTSNQNISINVTINGNADQAVTDAMIRKIKQELYGRGA